MRQRQRLTRGNSEFIYSRVRLVARHFEKQFTCKRITIGVESGGRKCEQNISRSDRLSVDDLLAVNNTNDKTCNVVFTFVVETRHLGRFTTKQYATILTTTIRHALDDTRHNVRRQLPRRNVVEKEERSRALDQNVINAVIHEIVTNSVVHAGRKRDLELRSYSISRRNEHGLLQIRKCAVKHPAKTSNLGKRPFIERAAC